jgi:hypothetical protein
VEYGKRQHKNKKIKLFLKKRRYFEIYVVYIIKFIKIKVKGVK